MSIGELIPQSELTHDGRAGAGSYCYAHGSIAVEYLSWLGDLHPRQMLLQGFESSGACLPNHQRSFG